MDKIEWLSLSDVTSEDEETIRRKLKTDLLVQLTSNNEGIYIIAASDAPWKLDKPFLKRFSTKIFISPPSNLVRKNLLRKMLTGLDHVISEEELIEVSEQTQG